MIIVGYGQLLGGILLLVASVTMYLDGHLIFPIICALVGAMFLWDSIERDDDDDDFNGSVLLVR